jgi:hypothetical protein
VFVEHLPQYVWMSVRHVHVNDLAGYAEIAYFARKSLE